MGNIKAVIFDIYGVLGLNGWQAFKHKHFESRPEAWDALREIGRQVDAGAMETHELVSAVAKAANVPEAEVAKQLDDTIANEPLLDYIRSLRPEYKIGILSNASKPDIVEQIFSPEDQVLFDAVVTSYHSGHTKPEAQMFVFACQKLGVDPTECLFIDDQQRHLSAAADYGMRTVLYTSVQQTIAEITEVLARD